MAACQRALNPDVYFGSMQFLPFDQILVKAYSRGLRGEKSYITLSHVQDTYTAKR